MELVEELELTMEIGSQYVQGAEPREIGLGMDLSTQKVRSYIKQFKLLQRRNVQESGTLSEQMYDVLAEADINWRRLTKEAYELADEAKLDDDRKSALSAWSLIERIQKNRAVVFGDTAKHEDAELLRQLEEAHHNIELVKQALTNIAAAHPELKRELYEQLATLQKESPVLEASV